MRALPLLDGKRIARKNFVAIWKLLSLETESALIIRAAIPLNPKNRLKPNNEVVRTNEGERNNPIAGKQSMTSAMTILFGQPAEPLLAPMFSLRLRTAGR